MATQQEIELSKAFGGTGTLTPEQQAAINQARTAFAPQTTTQTTSPTTTGAIKLPETQQITPDMSTATGRLTYYDQLIKDQEAQAEQARIDREQAIKEREATRTKQGGIVDLIKGIGQKRTEELTNLGFEPTKEFAQQKAQLAEIDSLYKDYNATVARRDQQIANIYGSGGGTDFQNNAIAQINRNANVLLTQKSSNINAKMAIMEYQQGNFENAQKFVNQAITDYTAGLQADYNMLESFIEDNNDLIDSLEADYKDALKTRQALILDQINMAREDKQQEIDNAFKREGLNLQWAQEGRLDRGSTPTSPTATDWTDLQIKSAINGILKDSPDATYEEVLQEINSDPTILNKDRAIQLAKNKFGIKEPSKQLSEVLNMPKPYTTGGIKSPLPKSYPQTTTTILGQLGSALNPVNFFANLFGQ
jgi:hypothetical protein